MFGAEMLNPAIRRSTDLYSLVDSHLVVLIPHISTDDELHRKKSRRMYVAGAVATIILIGAVAVFFILPPIDTLFDKIMQMILR